MQLSKYYNRPVDIFLHQNNENSHTSSKWNIALIIVIPVVKSLVNIAAPTLK